MNLLFGETFRLKYPVRLPVLALMITSALLILVVPGTYSAQAINCDNNNSFWNPWWFYDPDAWYSQTATACTGYMAVSSATGPTGFQVFFVQSGTYTFAACHISQGQSPYCDQSNAIFYKSVDLSYGVFPNDSATYNANGANSWYTTLNVTIKETAQGTTQTFSNVACESTVAPCPK